MQRSRNWRIHYALGVFLALLLLLVWALPSNARPACNTYSNSAVVMSAGYVYCGSVGGHCTECVSFSGGGVSACWSDGYNIICEDGSGGYYIF